MHFIHFSCSRATTNSRSSVAFRSVVRLAEHLAVFYRCSAAVAPCCHVVGIHVLLVPYLRVVGIVTDCTKRAVGDSFGSCGKSLLFVNGSFGCLVEYANVKQFFVGASAQHIFENAFAVFHIWVAVEFLYFSGNLLWIIRF